MPPRLPHLINSLAAVFGNSQTLSWKNGSPEEHFLRLQLYSERERLRKGPGPNKLERDRFARAHSRKLMKGVRRKKINRLPVELLIAKRQDSPILDTLYPERQSKWTAILQRPDQETPPSIDLLDFSMLSNPENTLKSFRRIAEVEATEKQAYLNFCDPYCLDAGAFLLLAEVWPKLAKIFEGGRMELPVQKVLHATALGRNNKMRLRAAELLDDLTIAGLPADVWAFPLQRRRAAGSSRSSSVHLDPQTREEAADKFCNAVDNWLGVSEISQELTLQGRGRLASIIGELLCNAERHSRAGSTDGDWSIIAFMVRRNDKLFCFMAFLSVGRSIAESLDDADDNIKKKRDTYIDKHKNRGFSANDLATLFALQDTITRDQEAWHQGSGGTGLQDVLEFVEFLGGPSDADDRTRITIVSGNTCISLRHPYLCGRRRDTNQPRLLWCNAENSAEFPPEPGFVTSMSERLSGTLVSVAFRLDPEYLASLVEDQNVDN